LIILLTLKHLNEYNHMCYLPCFSLPEVSLAPNRPGRIETFSNLENTYQYSDYFIIAISVGPADICLTK